MEKNGPQGPQKLSSVKSLKIQPHPLKTRKSSEMASLSNARWQNRKESKNRSTNNGFLLRNAIN